MKSFLILSTLVACAFAAKLVYFTTANDFLDVDKIMKRPEEVKAFVYCFVDLGPCNALSQSYKVIMPEAVSTACYRCNDAQKHLWHGFLWSLKADYPDLYDIFQEKYDEKKIYLEALEKAVENF